MPLARKPPPPAQHPSSPSHAALLAPRPQPTPQQPANGQRNESVRGDLRGSSRSTEIANTEPTLFAEHFVRGHGEGAPTTRADSSSRLIQGINQPVQSFARSPVMELCHCSGHRRGRRLYPQSGPETQEWYRPRLERFHLERSCEHRDTLPSSHWYLDALVSWFDMMLDF